MRHQAILHGAVAPRALVGRVRADANADSHRLIAEIRDTMLNRLVPLEQEVGGMKAQAMLGGGGHGTGIIAPPEPEYTATFASYARSGGHAAADTLRNLNMTGERAAIQAAMTEGDNSSGGYLAPVEWDRQINKSLRTVSPMRSLSKVVVSGRAAYSTLWSFDQWGSGWVGETAVRPATTTPAMTPLIFPAGEIYAMPAVTQRLLDDSAVDLNVWLQENLTDEFARQEGLAFIAGDGVNKPMGFLQYLPGGLAAAAVVDGSGNVTTPATAGAHPAGNLSTSPSGAAAAITGDALVDLKYGLRAPYRQNASWLMSSITAAAIAKLKDGQGNYLWREAFMANQPATLLGSPVTIDENMPGVAAGNTPVAYGDFQRGYLINDRMGIRILRDAVTTKPFILFYSTKRVGGGLLDPAAIRVMKIGAN